jgi:hypothetical protein
MYIFIVAFFILFYVKVNMLEVVENLNTLFTTAHKCQETPSHILF